jgi:hypothetical protein
VKLEFVASAEFEFSALQCKEAKVMRLLAASLTFITLIAVTGMLQPGASAEGRGNGAQRNNPCTLLPHLDVPQATISNGLINAIVYLPDPRHGYYRSTRFDWAGVIPCLAYKGHTYFGAWSPNHNPLVADSIAGPVEEFRSADGGLGYGDAKAGQLFVKPGVGVLRKPDDSPYRYQFFYPIVDSGKWTVRTRKNGVSFTQHLHSPIGYAYDYSKTLTLAKGEPIMVIHHRMENTGTKVIDIDVYDHDFFMLDNAPTGPEMVVHFAFTPKTTRPLLFGGEIVGNDLVYHQELEAQESVTSFLTGFSNNLSDYDITLENKNTGVGVEQTGDSPIANFNFWSVRSTIAPEAYVHLHIPPGKSQEWTIRYRFFAK